MLDAKRRCERFIEPTSAISTVANRITTQIVTKAIEDPISSPTEGSINAPNNQPITYSATTARMIETTSIRHRESFMFNIDNEETTTIGTIKSYPTYFPPTVGDIYNSMNTSLNSGTTFAISNCYIFKLRRYYYGTTSRTSLKYYFLPITDRTCSNAAPIDWL